MKKIAIFGMFVLASISMFAQNEVDALRYSQNFYTGTARFTSMGGAFGALGGDFSSLSVNPAGIGVYRSSEFTFTPGFSYNSTDATFMDGTMEDYKYRMNINNLGLVATYNSGKEDGWVTTSFAFGYNKLNDFNRNVIIEGTNNTSSMTDYFAQAASGTNSDLLDGFTTGLAWETYLIDPDPSSTQNYGYISALSKRGELQSMSINSKGNIGEYLFALGGNYSNKIYLGGSIGIQSVRYIEHSDYVESDPNDSIPDFNQFTYHSDLKTTGSGINFKFGAIIRPVDWIRIGLAVHSPTFMSLHDEYSSFMQSSFNSPDSIRGDGEKVYSPSGSFDYDLTTPFKAIGSLGFVIGKSALINVEYEFVDYSTARMRSDSYMFREENNAIETAYQAVGNIRAGAEYRFGPISFRAGYGLYGSPFRSNQVNADAEASVVSGGFGIRNEDFYFDLGFRYYMLEEKYFIYDPSVVTVSEANLKNNYASLIATFGFKF